MTTTNGAHVEVVLSEEDFRAIQRVVHTRKNPDGTYMSPDPLYVAPEPCHTTGRIFPSPLIREFLRSLGVLTCSDCHRYVGLAPRVERPMRRKGSGWRERP